VNLACSWYLLAHSSSTVPRVIICGSPVLRLLLHVWRVFFELNRRRWLSSCWILWGGWEFNLGQGWLRLWQACQVHAAKATTVHARHCMVVAFSVPLNKLLSLSPHIRFLDGIRLKVVVLLVGPICAACAAFTCTFKFR
jgi:hypothetical protein